MKKIATLLLFSMMMLVSFTVGAEDLRGDVDQDDRVSIADVTTLIDYLLTGDASGINMVNADTDRDTRVSIADVTTLIDYLLTSEWPQEEQNHEWIDLGLSSGTLWATCNIGANSPEEYGDYFAWGETEPKESYDFINYKWCNGEYGTLTKYLDRNDDLEPEDDAATVNWGNEWCMPSDEQLMELSDECTWEMTSRNGIYGCLLTGPNGNKLFFPAAGCYDAEPWNDGSIGYYWSCTLRPSGDGPFDPNAAFCMIIDEWGVDFQYMLTYRPYGRSVRPVRASQN
ncbi:MAG: dockerin type I repeat-containing protein [Muribaculaceae bacterium]|nr:dockerin type I repeat-containing protein [Muribaculaceae bacterium]